MSKSKRKTNKRKTKTRRYYIEYRTRWTIVRAKSLKEAKKKGAQKLGCDVMDLTEYWWMKPSMKPRKSKRG